MSATILASPAGWRRLNLVLALICLLAGMLYVGRTWSPSSYGVALRLVGAADANPVFGEARTIRLDEWAVITPLTQATVNNGLRRVNQTSLYQEDLRINYGLPVRDWGLFFKPTMWLYALVDPAYAYSFHFFMLSVLFFFGYAWLLRWLGAAPREAFWLAGGLYFTGFVQFWWTEKGPLFALFPFPILALVALPRLHLGLRVPLFAYAAVAWLLTNFYPPIQISLAFVGLALIAAREPALLRRRSLLPILGGAVLAAGIAALYLADYLRATSSTIYPGQRRVGGGAVPEIEWLSMLLPAIGFDRGFRSLTNQNICEGGTVGLYYTLLTLIMLDLRRLREAAREAQHGWLLSILLSGLLLMCAWMALPLPAWVGAPLLWNHVQPERMEFAAGVLLVCLTACAARIGGLRLTLPRLLAFFAVVVLGWGFLKYTPEDPRLEDLCILPGAALVVWAGRRWPGRAHEAIAAVSLCAGIFFFVRFNPVQSAWPIFHRAPTALTQGLDRLARHNSGVLTVNGLPGAVANGLGYRSASHLLAVPKLSFFRSRFAGMSDGDFGEIFNRYAHVSILPLPNPVLLFPDAIGVPGSIYGGSAPVRFPAAPAALPAPGGYLDQVGWEGRRLIFRGWAPFTGSPERHELEVIATPAAAGLVERVLHLRQDLAEPLGPTGVLSGFQVMISLTEAPGQRPVRLCVIAHDPGTGARSLLHNPPNVLPCLPAAPPTATPPAAGAAP